MNNFFSHKQLVLVIGALFSLPLFFSCSKEIPQQQPQHKYQFTASVFLTPSANTVSYDLFVSNDPVNRNDSFMIYAGTILAKDIKSNPFYFGFDFKEYRCKDFIVTPGKPLYGAIREALPAAIGYTYKKLDYNSVIIK